MEKKNFFHTFLRVSSREDKKHKPFFINLDLITKSFRNRLFDSYKVGYWRLNKFKTVYEICLSLIDHVITSSSRYHRNFVADGPVTNNRERRKRMESAGVAFPPSPSAGFSTRLSCDGWMLLDFSLFSTIHTDINFEDRRLPIIN